MLTHRLRETCSWIDESADISHLDSYPRNSLQNSHVPQTLIVNAGIDRWALWPSPLPHLDINLVKCISNNCSFKVGWLFCTWLLWKTTWPLIAVIRKAIAITLVLTLKIKICLNERGSWPLLRLTAGDPLQTRTPKCWSVGHCRSWMRAALLPVSLVGPELFIYQAAAR